MSTKALKYPIKTTQTSILVADQTSQIEEVHTLISDTTGGELKVYDPNHPDIHSVYEHPETVITIEMVRMLKKRLIFKPYALSTQIGVIFHAHNLTTEAQNTLLKILEDPPNNTYFILVTHQYKKLLETILSRAQLIHRASPNIGQTRQKTLDFDETDITSAFEKISSISAIKDPHEKRQYCHNILDSLTEKYYQKWLTSHQHDKVVLAQLNEIQKTRDAIDAKVNMRLCLESLVLQFNRDK